MSSEIDEITIDDETVKQAFDKYLSMRRELGRESKPISLMDMGTIGSRYLKFQGIQTGVDESEEINACTVNVSVDINGKEEPWLFSFKNETHNHPTEIEPFGGAATCIGGCIRDPLSGRSYVYQAMRVTGAGDPRVDIAQTLQGKLPQRTIVTTAAAGYSSYGNQIGLATGQVSELYHPKFVAKRMEVGAVVAAAPKHHVRREVPSPGDQIILLGGRTGRDGIGGATGSSKAHNVDSITLDSAEVQKGNAPVERKLQRLFRREEACKLIKRCNDFGAGGVSVAVGELADGLLIHLDSVPKKYEGLDGTELAIAESQERMAVVVSPNDVDEFLAFAAEENLEATIIASVTQEPRMVMVHRGEPIVDLSREFLASNGARKHQSVHVSAPQHYSAPWQQKLADNAHYSLQDRCKTVLADINVSCNKGLSERFDSTIGAGTVLMPFGGLTQLTPPLAMVAKFPVFGETTTVSAMSWGYNPYLSDANQYSGAYLAVVESLCKLVATGFSCDKAYLSFQEYFEKLRHDPRRWGKPCASMLGALQAQLDYGVGAIGGKDSMSGSFEDLDVPPTLVSFAVSTGHIDHVVSPEFKKAGSIVLRLRPRYMADGITPEPASLLSVFNTVTSLVSSHSVQAISTTSYGGTAEALLKMTFGNRIGLNIDAAHGMSVDELFDHHYGTFFIEAVDAFDIDSIASAEDAPFDVDIIGHTTDQYQLAIGETIVDLDALQDEWESTLASVFPFRSNDIHKAADDTSTGDSASTVDAPHVGMRNDAIHDPTHDHTAHGDADHDAETHDAETHGVTTGIARRHDAVAHDEALATRHHIYHGKTLNGKPRVIIPVFPGNNCEYDVAAAFRRAGGEPDIFVINNLSAKAVKDSVDELTKRITSSQIIMLPGGFSGGDEPDGSAKFITAFFRAPQVSDAVRHLLNNSDGLILGICNGFQALIKLGLLTDGDITDIDDQSPTLTFNTIGRHQSRLVRTRVTSTMSPWFSTMSQGDIHTIAISHGEGRFVAPQSILEKLQRRGQIATQYVDELGNTSMDLDVNPNGSMLCVEGITSPDGRVFGKMGHSERYNEGLYLNVPGNRYQPLFEAGVKYFQ